MTDRQALTSEKRFLSPRWVLSPSRAQKLFFGGKSLTSIHLSWTYYLLLKIYLNLSAWYDPFILFSTLYPLAIRPIRLVFTEHIHVDKQTYGIIVLNGSSSKLYVTKRTKIVRCTVIQPLLEKLLSNTVLTGWYNAGKHLQISDQTNVGRRNCKRIIHNML